MNIIDSHCHCHYLEPNWIKNNAMVHGPYRLKFLINVSTKGDDGQLWITNNFDHYKGKMYHYNNEIFMGYSVGWHPQENITVDENILRHMASGAIAMGEIGFDVGPNSPSMDLQISNFHTQMKIAKDNQIPSIIHCRDGWDNFFSETINYRQHPMIIHCFTGDITIAKKLIEEYNCLISISGIVTYKKADEIREAVKIIPIERILVETDTPFLTPYNYRKQGHKENNPLLMVETIEYVSKLKEIPVETMVNIINNNFKKFFPMVAEILENS